jgi:hypothetical protein
MRDPISKSDVQRRGKHLDIVFQPRRIVSSFRDLGCRGILEYLNARALPVILPCMQCYLSVRIVENIAYIHWQRYPAHTGVQQVSELGDHLRLVAVSL